jgi:hypothetical protein
MRWVRDSSLSIFFLVLCLVTIVGQAFAGHRDFNEEQVIHDDDKISLGSYVFSSDFGEALLENWQSEFLQFSFFILATVWLVQRGSNESKRVEEIGLESDQKQRIGGYADERSPKWAKTRGWRTAIYSNSLMIAMSAVFIASWATQSITGWTQFNDEQRDHDEPTLSWAGYIAKPDFWEKTFQNWQSEFLAVGTMAAFTIFLRQRGSPESKPVGAPHDETATSG